MKKYNRIMLGRGGMFSKQCREEGYIGANFDINTDLSDSPTEAKAERIRRSMRHILKKKPLANLTTEISHIHGGKIMDWIRI